MKPQPPIFIVGAPRSGTTLLRNMLNRHPRIAICMETWFYSYIYSRRWAFGDLADPRRRELLVNEYLVTKRIRVSGMDLAQLRTRLLREGADYRLLFLSLLEEFAESQGKLRCGEKTPNHALFTETLCEWYPNAVILHLVRDPREVVASLQRVPWASNSVLINAKTWAHYNLAVRRSRHRPGYLLIHYQDLVRTPEEEMRRVCAKLDEEYSESMLQPATEAIPLGPWSQRSMGAASPERLGKWDHELTEEEVAIVEWVTGSHLEEFGYQRVTEAPSRHVKVRGFGNAFWTTLTRQLGYRRAIVSRTLHPTRLSCEEYWTHLRTQTAQKGLP